MNVRFQKFWPMYVIKARIGGSGFLISKYDPKDRFKKTPKRFSFLLIG